MSGSSFHPPIFQLFHQISGPGAACRRTVDAGQLRGTPGAGGACSARAGACSARAEHTTKMEVPWCRDSSNSPLCNLPLLDVLVT